MRFLPGVPPHVHHQHVLRLEGLLLPGAVVPLADERLLVGLNVVFGQVLKKEKLNVINRSRTRRAALTAISYNAHFFELTNQTVMSGSVSDTIIIMKVSVSGTFW